MIKGISRLSIWLCFHSWFPQGKPLCWVSPFSCFFSVCGVDFGRWIRTWWWELGYGIDYVLIDGKGDTRFATENILIFLNVFVWIDIVRSRVSAKLQSIESPFTETKFYFTFILPVLLHFSHCDETKNARKINNFGNNSIIKFCMIKQILFDTCKINHK